MFWSVWWRFVHLHFRCSRWYCNYHLTNISTPKRPDLDKMSQWSPPKPCSVGLDSQLQDEEELLDSGGGFLYGGWLLHPGWWKEWAGVWEAHGSRVLLCHGLYPYPKCTAEHQLSLLHVRTIHQCCRDADTPCSQALRMYVRGMSTGAGVARTPGDMLQLRRRDQRAFVHWQITLVRGSVKMGVTSTVLIATGLQADCKFMAVGLPRGCAFTLPYPWLTTTPSKLLWLGHTKPIAFTVLIPLISLAYVLDKESVC